MELCHVLLSRVTCHKCVSHVVREWAMSHMNESCHTWMSPVTHEWVMPDLIFISCLHVWMHHVVRDVIESCHKCVSHVICRWVVSHMNVSCRTWRHWVMSHMCELCYISMSRVTYECVVSYVTLLSHVTNVWVMSYVDESCHIWMFHVVRDVSESSHKCMSHVTYRWVVLHMNVSCRTWRYWVTSLMYESCYISMSRVTYECVMSYVTSLSPVTYVWVMSRWVMSHVNAPCLTWMSHVMYRMSHVTCQWVMSHVNESRHMRISHGTHVNESCHTSWIEWDMTHSHASRDSSTCDMDFWHMKYHISKTHVIYRLRHVTYQEIMPHVNQSCCTWIRHATYDWVVAHVTSHVQYEWVTWRRKCGHESYIFIFIYITLCARMPYSDSYLLIHSYEMAKFILPYQMNEWYKWKNIVYIHILWTLSDPYFLIHSYDMAKCVLPYQMNEWYKWKKYGLYPYFLNSFICIFFYSFIWYGKMYPAISNKWVI